MQHLNSQQSFALGYETTAHIGSYRYLGFDSKYPHESLVLSDSLLIMMPGEGAFIMKGIQWSNISYLDCLGSMFLVYHKENRYLNVLGCRKFNRRNWILKAASLQWQPHSKSGLWIIRSHDTVLTCSLHPKDDRLNDCFPVWTSWSTGKLKGWSLMHNCRVVSDNVSIRY